MNSKLKMYNLNLLLAILFPIVFIFRNFPVMGHDYSYYLPALFDFNYAFQELGVFFYEFTPQKCGGVPVWFNPSGMTLSSIHFLAAILEPVIALMVFNLFIFLFSYIGANKFLEKFDPDQDLNSTFSLAWCLQTYFLCRGFVGHFQYVTLALLPLIAFCIFYKNLQKKLDYLILLVPSLIWANDIYMGATNVFVLSTGSILIFYLFEIFYFKKTCHKYPFLILSLCIGVSLLIAFPKIIASYDLISNIQREVSFTLINFFQSFLVTTNMMFSFFETDYSLIADWSFGNWEAINCLLPGIFIFNIYQLRNEKMKLKKYALVILIIFVFSMVIVSGIYSSIVQDIPILNSLHVNPRYVFVFNLSLFLIHFLVFKEVKNSKFNYIYPFIVITIAINHLSYNSLGPPYHAYLETDVEKNVVNYCYEPVFGYKLEHLSQKAKTSNFKDLVDPRCYLKSYKSHCDSAFNLNSESLILLNQYKLSTP